MERNFFTHFIVRYGKIFIEVLDEEDLVIRSETTADDIDEWDSLTHIQLIIAIEIFFDIKFTASEIHSYLNVDEMCKAIESKTEHT